MQKLFTTGGTINYRNTFVWRKVVGHQPFLCTDSYAYDWGAQIKVLKFKKCYIAKPIATPYVKLAKAALPMHACQPCTMYYILCHTVHHVHYITTIILCILVRLFLLLVSINEPLETICCFTVQQNILQVKNWRQ